MVNIDKIANQIVSSIKKSFTATKKSDNFKTVSIELCYDYSIKNNTTLYEIDNGWNVNILKKKITGLTSSDIASLASKIIEGVKTLQKTKGWSGLSYEMCNIENPNRSIYYNTSVKFPYKFTLIEDPCKEFKSLANFITKHSNVIIDPMNVYGVYVGGKRGYVYGEEGDRTYLCHKPKQCEKMLAELKDVRGSKDSFLCVKKTYDDIDPIDLQYSIRHETEFDGYRHNGYEITIKTPTGRVKKTLMIA